MNRKILDELQERANLQGELMVPGVGIIVPKVEPIAEPEPETKFKKKYEKEIPEEVNE